MPLWRNERPVLFKLCSGPDPFLQHRDFVWRKRLALGRHALGLVGRGDASDERTIRKIARHDGVQSGIQLGNCSLRLVESQTAFVRVRAMATEAAAGKNRLHVAREVDGAL